MIWLQAYTKRATRHRRTQDPFGFCSVGMCSGVANFQRSLKKCPPWRTKRTKETGLTMPKIGIWEPMVPRSVFLGALRGFGGSGSVYSWKMLGGRCRFLVTYWDYRSETSSREEVEEVAARPLMSETLSRIAHSAIMNDQPDNSEPDVN